VSEPIVSMPKSFQLDKGVKALYIDLLKKCLTRSLFDHPYRPLQPRGPSKRLLNFIIRKILAPYRLELVRKVPLALRRFDGSQWPAWAETMVSLKGLDNIEHCVIDLIRRNVPGDLIETGVWRGGAAIFMRGILKAYDDTKRVVWVADSFEGLPKPDPTRYPYDSGDDIWTFSQLKVSLEEVKRNFARYGLLDDQVRFLGGWFRDTLPHAPIERLALLRLDGDMYESTIQALQHLYSKVSVGGYIIIDDYGLLEPCRAAVEDFRAQNGISEALNWIDWSVVYWQRQQ